MKNKKNCVKRASEKRSVCGGLDTQMRSICRNFGVALCAKREYVFDLTSMTWWLLVKIAGRTLTELNVGLVTENSHKSRSLANKREP